MDAMEAEPRTNEDAMATSTVLAKEETKGEDGRTNEEDEFAAELAARAWELDRRRVSVQLPRELWPRSASLARRITRQMVGKGVPDAQVFLLLSSTRSRCCEDALAADHADSELLVHVGPSCRTRPRGIHVIHVAPPLSASWHERLLEAARCACERVRAQEVDQGSAEPRPIVVGVGWRWMRVATMLEEKLHSLRAIIMKRHVDRNGEPHWKSSGSLSWTMDDGDDGTENGHLVWLGEEDEELRALQMQYTFQSAWRWDPKEDQVTRMPADATQAVRRRHFFVEKAKLAQVVGVAVESVADAETRSTVKRVEKMARNANKTVYVFVMSRVAPAKLANFPEVDVFVLVACPYTCLVDSKQYYAPVITTYEAELAFTDTVWTGKYRFGLSLVNEADQEGSAGERASHHESSGRELMEPAPQELAQLDMETKLQSVVKDRGLSLTGNRGIQAANAAEFLSMRTYKGLILDGPEDPNHEIKEGLSGRAALYQHEPGSRESH